MYIEYSTDSDEVLLQLIELRDELNTKLSALLRHYTGISSTLLALLTVFGDIGGLSLAGRILLLLSMTCLLACVVSGVWCCMAIHRVLEKTLGTMIDRLRSGDSDASGVTPVRSGFSFFARFCPCMLCLGVLFLWMSGISILFF